MCRCFRSNVEDYFCTDNDTNHYVLNLLFQKLLIVQRRIFTVGIIMIFYVLQMNMGVRKLADNLQTVKTVLGMKIQSEQKLVSIMTLKVLRQSIIVRAIIWTTIVSLIS